MSTSVAIPSKQQTRPSAEGKSVAGSGGLWCELLNPAEYEGWDALVDRSPHGTVFHYSWWLKVAAQGFDILVSRDKRGSISGGVPLTRRKHAGFTLFHSPPLTPFLGPIFDVANIDDSCERLYVMRSTGEMLARQMPRFDSYRCMVGALGPDLQGFLWAGFRAELAYTFRFPTNRSINAIETHITRTHLQKLAKAKRLGLFVTRNDDIDAFAKLCEVGSAHAGRLLYPGELPIRLWSAAFQRGKSDFYIARMADNTPVAVLLTVHDARTTYQIVSAFDPEKREIPGSYLALWAAVGDALEAGRDFDFEGSALRGVEQYYRKWGATAFPIWRLERARTLRGALVQSAARYRARAEREASYANWSA